MNQILSRLFLAVVAFASAGACTPFLGPLPDGAAGSSGRGPLLDGGGGASGSPGSSGSDGATVNNGVAGTAGTSDSGVEVAPDVPASAPDAEGTSNGAACSFDTDCRFGHCVEGV